MNVLPWHKREFERLIKNRHQLPHALLLHGRQGTGKLFFARALAQALLCEDPLQSGVACGRCAACGWFASANHPDLRSIEPTERGEVEEGGEKKASAQITIEQIRELPEFINVSSHRGGPKVVLIHPADALNVNAANALLKSLEEPPSGTYFLLVAHRAHSLLATVKSRCRQIVLPEPDPGAAVEWLRAEGVRHPTLVLAQTGNAPLLAAQFTAQEYRERREFFLGRIAERSFDPLLVAEQISDYPIQDVVSWLQKWTFDVIFQKFLGRVRYNPDYAEAISTLAEGIEALSMLRFHRDTVRLQRVINHPLNPRLFIEQLLLDYAGLVGAAQSS